MRVRGVRVRVVVVLLLVPLLLVGCGRRGGGDHGRDTAGSGRAPAARESGDARDDGPGLGDLPVPDIEIGGSGGGEAATPTQAPRTQAPRPRPTPTDAKERAFRAVARGTCLPVHRNGAEWNVSAPPDAVSCRSARAGLFEVTRTATRSVSCPSGTGQARWSYRSAVTGGTTTLCLNRVWVRDYCVLAEQSGDTISSIGSLTAASCDDTRVPRPYNQVVVVDAVYRAPAGAGADHCRRSAQDNRRYWSLLADDGATLVCFRARS
ncbi:hypothetical protein ABWI13_15905 [Streptomyces koyangensis]|uniref:hypothetical protein n=1 Tax=Streptomyces koyangensis TaxID=188770 RepID=UPI003397B9AC